MKKLFLFITIIILLSGKIGICQSEITEDQLNENMFEFANNIIEVDKTIINYVQKDIYRIDLLNDLYNEMINVESNFLDLKEIINNNIDNLEDTKTLATYEFVLQAVNETRNNYLVYNNAYDLYMSINHINNDSETTIKLKSISDIINGIDKLLNK